MHLRTVCLFSFLSFTSSFLLAQQEVLQVETYRLDNGLTVLLNEDSTATKVFGAVLVNAGSKNEDPKATGMAHYLEHMLFKGTQTLGTWNYQSEEPLLDSIRLMYDALAECKDADLRASIQRSINGLAVRAAAYGLPNEMDKLLKSIGSTEINAFTTYDMTFFHNSFPSHEITRWLDLYAARFIDPVFRSFQSELEVVYEEKNRAMDSFERRIFEEVMLDMFPNLPYGQWSTLGTIHDLKNPSLSKMQTFYDKHYVPGNMALVLTGNFDKEAVKPVIEEKFGVWQAKPVPHQDFPDPTPFDGTQVIKKRMTPIRGGLLGFQTPPYDHPDRVAASVCEFLFYNSAKTGSIDRLDLEGKLLYTGAFSLTFNDVSAYILFYAPKLIGQSLGRAEKYAQEALNYVRQGFFTEEELEAAKKQVSREFQKNLENLEMRGILIGGAFNAGLSWEEVLAVPEKAESITREDILRVANQYYGDHHLKLVSRMGFSHKNKLKKPPYKPVLADQSKESVYARNFDSIPETSFRPRFLDFEKDIARDNLSGGHEVITSLNPLNQLFSLEIRFKKGTIADPILEYVAKVANYAGTSNLSSTALKQQFANLGAQYRFTCSPNHLILKVEGDESVLEQTLRLIQDVIMNLKLDAHSCEVMVNNEKAERRLERRSAATMGNALLNYAVYDTESYFYRRLKLKEVKRLKASEVQTLWEQTSRTFQAEVVYSGRHQLHDLTDLLESVLPEDSTTHVFPYTGRPIQSVEATQILLIPTKKAVQSHVYFVQPVSPLDTSEFARINAFNEYFGGGFSGLTIQEIREYRSLAYDASAWVFQAPVEGARNCLIGHLACQTDKTDEAVQVMYNLLAQMPEKPERIPALRKILQESIITDYPDFKELTDRITDLQLQGYHKDPNIAALPIYEQLEMEDIRGFYQQYLQDRPVIIAIYGDKRDMDMKRLKEIGPVKTLRLHDVISF